MEWTESFFLTAGRHGERPSSVSAAAPLCVTQQSEPGLAGVHQLIPNKIFPAGVGEQKSIALQNNSPVLRSSWWATPCNFNLDVILSLSIIYERNIMTLPVGQFV